MGDIQSGLATLGGSGWTCTESFTKTNVADQAVHPGEDATFDRQKMVSSMTESALATADTLIKTGAGKIGGYVVHVVTAVGVVEIRDSTSAGAGTVKITIPIAKAVGEYPLSQAIDCATGIYLDYAPTATGTIGVLYI